MLDSSGSCDLAYVGPGVVRTRCCRKAMLVKVGI